MNIHVLYLNQLTRQSLEHLFASNESLCMDACDASLCTCAEWMELFPKTNPDIVLVEHAALQQWEIPDKTIHHLNRLHAMILVEQVWTEHTADWALRHAFHGMIGCSELTPREFYRLLHMSKLRHQHTTRLQGLRDQSQKMEAVGRMAGGIAHDYNNMLTVIVNNACMARELADDESMIAEELDELIASTRHAAELTRRLLIMSRNKPVAPQYFSVHAMIQSMQRILKHITGERILLQVTLCDEDLKIMADQSQLEQVILNLVINACDAMWYEGTLQLGITHYRYESNDSDIFYDELPEEGIDYACISLQDTGCGISAENLSRIFEPFFSTKPTDKGTGLGLFQVYTTIRQHKGVISVQSIPEEGSAFHLFLPCAEKTVSVDKAISNIPVPVGCETILLIEDDPIVRRTTRRVLSHLGYTVIEVAHPHAAGKLTHAQMQHVDLLLVDAMLPYIDGITFARTCVGTYPHMKVLIISGFPEDQLASIGMIPCEFPLLTKPYFRETLATRIRHLLDAE